MATYSVVAQDGQMYGPANEGAVAQWIQEGRVRRDTVLHCHDTNARCFAWTVSALQPALGLSGAEVAQVMQDVRGIQQAQQPLAAPVANGGNANFIAYQQPQTGMDAGRVTVTAFPVIGSVLLSLFVPLFALIYYGIVHGNLPRRRPDDPSAAKAIGFSFIPIFNIYWAIFFWIRLCTRINDESVRVGLPPTAPRNLVIAICWCYLGLFIPILNILAAIAQVVMIIIVLVQLQTSLNRLAEATQRGVA